MIGFFEACYFGCGPCGTSCATLDAAHDKDLRRQYSSIRAPIAGRGALALENSVTCVSATTSGAIVLADCAGAAPFELDSGGHLAIGDLCLATGPGNADPVVLEPCQDTPEQYWVVGDGMVWNGRPPLPTGGMDFNHVRCLSAAAASGTPPISLITAPLCGDAAQPRWRFLTPGDAAAATR